MSSGPSFPTLPEAKILGEIGQDQVLINANGTWMHEAVQHILSFPPGHEFIAEDVVIFLTHAGFTTPNHKVIGPVMRRLSLAGHIRQTGDIRPARTSHHSAKPIWVRLATDGSLPPPGKRRPKSWRQDRQQDRQQSHLERVETQTSLLEFLEQIADDDHHVRTCDVCGERALAKRTGAIRKCHMTPKCPGHLRRPPKSARRPRKRVDRDSETHQ